MKVTTWLLFKPDIVITEKYEEGLEKTNTQSDDQ